MGESAISTLFIFKYGVFVLSAQFTTLFWGVKRYCFSPVAGLKRITPGVVGISIALLFIFINGDSFIGGLHGSTDIN